MLHENKKSTKFLRLHSKIPSGSKKQKKFSYDMKYFNKFLCYPKKSQLIFEIETDHKNLDMTSKILKNFWVVS